jgi:hypothetical protein
LILLLEGHYEELFYMRSGALDDYSLYLDRRLQRAASG